MKAMLRWMGHQWDRSAAVGCALAGLVFILLGWLGLSGAALPTQQLPYLASGAVLGLFVLGIGATLWLSADLRDEWRKLDEIQDAIIRSGGTGPDLTSGVPESSPCPTDVAANA